MEIETFWGLVVTPLRALEYALTLDNMQSLGSVTWVIGDSQKRLCQTGTLYQVIWHKRMAFGKHSVSSYLVQEEGILEALKTQVIWHKRMLQDIYGS